MEAAVRPGTNIFGRTAARFFQEHWVIVSGSRSRSAIGIVLVGCILSACTIEPGDNAYVHIENKTAEQVVLTARSDQTGPTPQPFRTLEPGQADQRGLSQACEKTLSYMAVTPSGRTYTFGPPVCGGDVWSIGAK